MSSITLVHQKLQVEDARLITVSDIVAGTDGVYVRTVKFYGDPYVSGAPTALAEIVLRSENIADLEIQAPGFKY
ncbi:hypothetical protein QA639_21580 [Bradyrhizobium pachyrhizi]|uniref:hypothetical protein n=1 Tax=Bradyrhizobium pachyrhizi TaxID=280333 RepID=UPI0024B076E1|nr:hypothetical protein [Bradyrhizobium pachyrhizi]WFU52301.1 hypothetical protein QA639_21580 [Bradyrhizobium pachyrhizi]